MSEPLDLERIRVRAAERDYRDSLGDIDWNVVEDDIAALVAEAERWQAVALDIAQGLIDDGYIAEITADEFIVERWRERAPEEAA